MKIVAQRIVTPKGVRVFQITGIEAMGLHQLPALYLEGERPVVYMLEWEKDGESFSCLKMENVREFDGEPCCLYPHDGSPVSEENMEIILRHCAAATAHLTDVLSHLSKMEKFWNGEAVFLMKGGSIYR